MAYQKILYTATALVVGIIIIFGSQAIYLYLNQSRYVYFPTHEITGNPSDIGLLYEDVTIKTTDELNLSGWYIPAEKPGAVILFFHGNGGNISNRLDLIKIFYELRLSTFIIDYRGYGRSEGEPTEDGTYLDATAAWDYLVEKRKIAPDEIILFGRSLGGPIAAWLAKDNNPGVLILDSTFTSIKDIGAKLYPYLPIKRFFKFDYSTISYLKRVDCPVLIIHSRDDEYIPFSHAEKLFESANELKQFLEITGGHNIGFMTSKNIYAEGINSFISKY
mgnify:CR=1 FL=1